MLLDKPQSDGLEGRMANSLSSYASMFEDIFPHFQTYHYLTEKTESSSKLEMIEHMTKNELIWGNYKL